MLREILAWHIRFETRTAPARLEQQIRATIRSLGVDAVDAAFRLVVGSHEGPVHPGDFWATIRELRGLKAIEPGRTRDHVESAWFLAGEERSLRR